MTLILFRSGDDTHWHVVEDSLYDQLEKNNPEPFDADAYLKLVGGLLHDDKGNDKLGVKTFFTQDFVVEKVDLKEIKRIITLPMY